MARLDARGTACSAAGTRSDAALHRAGPGLDSTAKTATVSSEPMVTLVMVTKSLGSASLTISSHLRPKAMTVSVSAGRSGREGCVPAAQSRRMPERNQYCDRPGRYQGILYNGHKRAHCVKWQGTMLPNGIMPMSFGPINGRHHDAFMLDESRVVPVMRRACRRAGRTSEAAPGSSEASAASIVAPWALMATCGLWCGLQTKPARRRDRMRALGARLDASMAKSLE